MLTGHDDPILLTFIALMALLFLCFLVTSTQMDLQNFSMSPKPSLICIFFFIVIPFLVNYILYLDPKFQACVPHIVILLEMAQM